MNQIQDIVKTYYGETLSTSNDLKTDACTTADRPPPHVSAALAAVHDEVAAKYYGCGLAIFECQQFNFRVASNFFDISFKII